jgi:hypothetical protein
MDAPGPGLRVMAYRWGARLAGINDLQTRLAACLACWLPVNASGWLQTKSIVFWKQKKRVWCGAAKKGVERTTAVEEVEVTKKKGSSFD